MKIVRSYLETYRSAELEMRFFMVIAVTGIAFSALGAILNLLLGMGVMAVASMVSINLFISYILYRSVKTGRYVGYVYLTMLFLTLMLYPYIWLHEGGSHGTGPLLFIINIIMVAILLSRAHQIPMLLLNMAVLAGLFYIEMKFPGIIVQYPDEKARMVDFTVMFSVIFGSVFILIHRVMMDYNLKMGHLKDSHEKLNILSNTDPLSGLNNRRHVMKTLQQCIDRHSSESSSVIMIDIDKFKNINDTYGHSSGDQVIIKIAETLKSNIRKTDTVGRIGGEEFLIVLEGVGQDIATRVAEKLRALVESLTWEEWSEPVTISLGVYECGEEDSLNDVLENVDKRLYKAKDNGRNRVVLET